MEEWKFQDDMTNSGIWKIRIIVLHTYLFYLSIVAPSKWENHTLFGFILVKDILIILTNKLKHN